MSDKTTEPYLIWSNEGRCWWRKDRAGYTAFTAAAGRYTRVEALAICANAREGWQSERAPSEIPVRESDVREIEESRVVTQN